MEAVIEMDRIIKFFKMILKDSGLGVTYNDILILKVLPEYSTLKEVSDFLLIDKSHVSKTLKKFQEEGIVSKSVGTYPMRFTLTSKGEKILTKTDEIIKFIKKNDLSGLSGKYGDGRIKKLLRDYNSRLTSLYWED